MKRYTHTLISKSGASCNLAPYSRHPVRVCVSVCVCVCKGCPTHLQAIQSVYSLSYTQDSCREKISNIISSLTLRKPEMSTVDEDALVVVLLWFLCNGG